MARPARAGLQLRERIVNTTTMKRLLIVTAVIELGAGLGLRVVVRLPHLWPASTRIRSDVEAQ